MKKKRSIEEVFGVIGLGRFGIAVAQELALAGFEVLVADKNEDIIRQARQFTDNAYVARDLGIDSLKQMGFGECGTVIVCIGGQIDVSLLTVLNAVNLGVPHVIAKAVSTDHGALLEKIGAEVVYPERDMGVRLAKRLQSNTVMEYINLSNDIDITEVKVPPTLAGVTVIDSGLRKKYSLNIIAIQHGNITTTDIRFDHVLKSGEVLLLIGKSDDIERFLQENS